MENQTTIPTAYRRLFDVAVKVANHIGHIPTDQPDYNPMKDPNVLAFLEQAVFNEIQAQSQKAAHDAEVIRFFDELDKEL